MVQGSSYFVAHLTIRYPARCSVMGAGDVPGTEGGGPYLSLRSVRFHQLHHLSLLHQDDLGVPEPGDVQGLSRDERAHPRGAALQPLQGKRDARPG